MKKILHTLVAVLLMISSFAQNVETVELKSSFELKCILTSYYHKIKKANVKITESGKFYAEHSTKNGKFEFNLPKNSQFLLEFYSAGHFVKRIAISTEGVEEIEVPKLQLSLTLVEENAHYLLEKDTDLLDFPVAFVAFDSGSGSFYDKNQYYSDIILKGLNESTLEYHKSSAVTYE